MKKSIIILTTLFFVAASSLFMTGCYESKKIADKSGAQLWGENCNRCHNAPGPGEFNNDNWEIVSMHMQVRANLTKPDLDKIVDFLKGANN